MDYEERIKYRDNEFLYEKCCKQYNVLMEYQHKMSDYKQQIETLKDENDSLRTRIKTVKRRRNHESAKKRKLSCKVEELVNAYRDLSIENECLAHDNAKYYMRIKELEEENKKLKDGIQEVKRVGDFLKESECMLDGEYYIVHSDIVIELDKAIKKTNRRKGYLI